MTRVFRVEIQRRKPRFPHLSHLVVSVLTLGLWLPFWVLCYVSWSILIRYRAAQRELWGN